MTSRRLAVATLLGLSACQVAHHDIGDHRVSQNFSRDLDILFVVDNSPTMSKALPILATSLSGFADALQAASPPLTSFHIAFITSDMAVAADNDPCLGEGGQFHPECARGAPFISSVPGLPSFSRQQLGDALACMFPTKPGCVVQQPFAAVKAALPSPDVSQDGFLRRDADLVVVFIAGQDDCSVPENASPFSVLSPYQCATRGILCNEAQLPAAEEVIAFRNLNMCEAEERSDSQHLRTVDETASHLRGLKYSADQVFVILVAGPTAPFTIEPSATDPIAPVVDPSCTDNGFGALPPVRLQGLVKTFQSAGVWTSICDDTLKTNTLKIRLADATNAILARSKCLLATPRKGTPGSEQGQYQCTVTLQDFGGTTSIVPRCGSEIVTHCWQIIDDPDCKDSGLELALVWDPAPSGVLSADCIPENERD